MNLIEQLGGYEKAKRELELKEQNSILQCCASVTDDMIRSAMLDYRRQHNIFEVGDYFVNYADDAVYTALSIDQNNRMHGKSGDKNVWTYFGRFGLRHATDAEIKAGKRLEPAND